MPRDKAKVPASIETEQALLAAILLGSSADSPASVADEAMPIIEPSLFYDDKHRVILKAIRAVWARGYGVDSRMVFDELNSMGKAGEVGGATYLTTICGPIAGAGSMANWKGYLHILQEQARRRRYDELLLMARAHNIEGQDAHGIARADVMRHAVEPASFDSLPAQVLADKGTQWVTRWTQVVLK